MTRKFSSIVVLAFLLGASLRSTVPLSAQGPSVASAVDPLVSDALREMRSFLHTMTAFQVKAEVTTEDVLVDGQKIQHSSMADMIVRQPNRVRVTINNDRDERIFLYDGKTFAIWAPRGNYYASISAPSTIPELIEFLDEKFGIEMPLVDVFRWSEPSYDPGGISSAIDVGPSVVAETVCQQYALRQRGLDWQIWIQRGDYPLPRKVVATVLGDAARPEYTVRYAWNLAPAFTDASFVFLPPQGAQKVDIARLKAVADSLRHQQN